uniref:Uncharacterized protein n=1 Tax=Physcomitrium patens TaxID=3218 RepID=A0A2K1JZE0_PHYPA|nr:hypothetical protein PHYPA_014008 [Physcomitrium patens]
MHQSTPNTCTGSTSISDLIWCNAIVAKPGTWNPHSMCRNTTPMMSHTHAHSQTPTTFDIRFDSKALHQEIHNQCI